jgi:hypothetical protein
MASLKFNPERFWAKVNKTDTCWLWTACKDIGGYGNYYNQRAHRVAYEVLVGPIPDGMVLDHLCCVRACVNPEHLRVCTHVENVLAPHSVSPTAINQRKTHCYRGHPYTEETLMVKPDGRRECRICRRMGEPERKRRIIERRANGVPKVRIRPRKTHCKHGHVLNEATTQMRADGTRRCIACSRARWLRSE